MADQRQYCRHCRRRKIKVCDESIERQGLCFACYRQIDIRCLYMDVPFALLKKKLPPLAREATGELPGSEAKMRVMQARVARGEQACHPDDATEWTFGGSGYD